MSEQRPTELTLTDLYSNEGDRGLSIKIRDGVLRVQVYDMCSNMCVEVILPEKSLVELRDFLSN